MATLASITWDDVEAYIVSRTDLSQSFKDAFDLTKERAAYASPLAMYNALVAARDAIAANFRWANWRSIGFDPAEVNQAYIGFLDDARRIGQETVDFVNANGG